MTTNTLVEYQGKCPDCRHEYHLKYADIVVCDCWTKCPLCGQRMQDYTPDLSPRTYGVDGKRELQILKVCNNLAGHSDHSPFYSTKRPIEVELTREN